MTTATIKPPAPPADPTDPTACLTRKLLTLYHDTNFSLRMITIVGSILKDEVFSVKAFEPIVIKDGRVYSAGDNAFSLEQLDATFNRVLPNLKLTEAERTTWETVYCNWKSDENS